MVRPNAANAAANAANVATQAQIQQMMATMQALQQQNEALQAQTVAVQAQVADVQGLRQQNEAMQAHNVEVRNHVAGLQAIRQKNQDVQAQVNLLVQENQLPDGIPIQPQRPAFQPFSEEIEATPIPDNLNTLKMDTYDGTTDPVDHLASFNTKMLIYRVNDQLKCKLFPPTLKKAANAWFGSLSPRTVLNVPDFSARFIAQFSVKQVEKVTTSVLFEVRQKPGESINEYIFRFTDHTLQANNVSQATVAEAFHNGLRPGPFNDNLALRRPKTLEEIRIRASPFITQEENTLMKEKRELRENHKKIPATCKNSPPKTDTKGKSTFTGRTTKNIHAIRSKTWREQGTRKEEVDPADRDYTPLNTSPSRILKEQGHTDLFVSPRPLRQEEGRLNTKRYCDFHQNAGHDTDDCWPLKIQIENHIQEGRLKQYVKSRRRTPPRTPRRGRSPVKKSEKEKGAATLALGKPAGQLSTISGGA